MTRLTAKDFSPEILELYDYYVHGQLTRRGFLEKAGKYAVLGMSASSILAALSPNYALAQQVSFTDPDISAQYIQYPSPNGHGNVRAYLVKPTKVRQSTAGVVVVHENRGLNPYIEDVARRLAKAGYIALAPDGLSSVGGYPGNDEQGKALQAKVDPVKLMNDFFAAVEFLQAHKESNGKTGIIGFCYGGGVCNAASIAIPSLNAAIPFYGKQAKPEDVVKIKTPMLFNFAEKDPNIDATWPEYEKALKAAKVNYQAYFYPGTTHGFHNDSTPRYDEAAAKLAWQRSLDWFAQHLS